MKTMYNDFNDFEIDFILEEVEHLKGLGCHVNYLDFCKGKIDIYSLFVFNVTRQGALFWHKVINKEISIEKHLGHKPKTENELFSKVLTLLYTVKKD